MRRLGRAYFEGESIRDTRVHRDDETGPLCNCCSAWQESTGHRNGQYGRTPGVGHPGAKGATYQCACALPWLLPTF
jgi:hypothetical protein